jgi:hypothetical protein
MKGLSTEEYKALVRSVGTHRGERPLSPLEVSTLIKRSISAGSTRKECAEALQLGTTQIATFLKLFDLSPSIQHWADWGGSNAASISFSALAELGRLRYADQYEAARAILEHGLTWKEVIQLVQLADRSKKPISTCIQEVLKLRPQIETRYVLVGALTSPKAKRQIENLSQQERDQLFGRLLIKEVGVKEPVSWRLGTDSFTVLSDREIAKSLNITPDALEKILNEALEKTRIADEPLSD